MGAFLKGGPIEVGGETRYPAGSIEDESESGSDSYSGSDLSVRERSSRSGNDETT